MGQRRRWSTAGPNISKPPPCFIYIQGKYHTVNGVLKVNGTIGHHPALSIQGKYHTVNGVLKVNGTIGNSPVQFLLDSGAAVSVIHYTALPAANYNCQCTSRSNCQWRGPRSFGPSYFTHCYWGLSVYPPFHCGTQFDCGLYPRC